MSKTLTKPDTPPGGDRFVGTILPMRRLSGRVVFYNSLAHVVIWNFDPNHPKNTTILRHEHQTIEGMWYYHTKLISEISVYYNETETFCKPSGEGKLSRNPLDSWFTYSDRTENRTRKGWFGRTVHYSVTLPEDIENKTNQNMLAAIQKAQSIEAVYKQSLVRLDQADELVTYLTEPGGILTENNASFPALLPVKSKS